MGDDENNFNDVIILESSLYSAIHSPPYDKRLFSDTPFQSEEAATWLDYNEPPNCSYEEGPSTSIISSHNPFLDCLKETEQEFELDVGDFLEYLEEPPFQVLTMEEQKSPPQILNMEEQKSPEQIVTISTTTNIMEEIDNQQYNECTINPMAYHFEDSVAPLPYPQQSLIQSIYNDNEQFISPISSETMMKYPNMDANLTDLYKERINFSIYNEARGQGFFPGGNVSMLMSTPTPISMPSLKMDYQNRTMMLPNNQSSFQQYGYGSTNVQLLSHRHPQQQQLNINSLAAGCDDTTLPEPNISNLDESTSKIGRISVEEKKEKIGRYMEKRKRRNFSKKTKYECRKNLADKRPRIRGKFAKIKE